MLSAFMNRSKPEAGQDIQIPENIVKIETGLSSEKFFDLLVDLACSNYYGQWSSCYYLKTFYTEDNELVVKLKSDVPYCSIEAVRHDNIPSIVNGMATSSVFALNEIKRIITEPRNIYFTKTPERAARDDLNIDITRNFVLKHATSGELYAYTTTGHGNGKLERYYEQGEKIEGIQGIGNRIVWNSPAQSRRDSNDNLNEILAGIDRSVYKLYYGDVDSIAPHVKENNRLIRIVTRSKIVDAEMKRIMQQFYSFQAGASKYGYTMAAPIVDMESFEGFMELSGIGFSKDLTYHEINNWLKVSKGKKHDSEI